MKIIQRLKVPTGDIAVVTGEKGKLELLSIGDYGKDVNLRCDSMGLTQEIGRVEHGPMLPLEEKWVVTISTQYGCSMRCTFCDVPIVGPGRNATLSDLVGQVLTGISLHPEVTFTDRLNLHYARMGEPSWNPAVLDSARWLADNLSPMYELHPVVSTMMPRHNPWLGAFIRDWMEIKNEVFQGEAGLQLSINSTCEVERAEMFSKNACSLYQIAQIMGATPFPKGRKITLNFAVAGFQIDPDRLLAHFDPEKYILKLTPMHRTRTAEQTELETAGDACTMYPYQEIERDLKEAGYEVLVFVASEAEDESLITCGNAILSGSRPRTDYTEIRS